jgi:hypothetical protein
MSIDYSVTVYAVGPADKIAQFREKVLAVPATYGDAPLELYHDLPNCVALCDTSSRVYPELFYFGMADEMPVEDITMRVFLVTECTLEAEYVLEKNQRVYYRQAELELSADIENTEHFPEIMLGEEGNAKAWSEACARYDVDLNNE